MTAANEQPAAPSTVVERVYASEVCPHCGQRLDPLPKAKKKCPQCGQPMYVRSGPDGLTYLLREADLEAHEQRWVDYHDEQGDREDARINAAAAALTAESLARMAEFGAKAQFSAMPDACPACRALNGRVFEPQAAPPIPVPGCANEICRCDYSPLL